jgi:hypothetical protein
LLKTDETFATIRLDEALMKKQEIDGRQKVSALGKFTTTAFVIGLVSLYFGYVFVINLKAEKRNYYYP